MISWVNHPIPSSFPLSKNLALTAIFMTAANITENWTDSCGHCPKISFVIPFPAVKSRMPDKNIPLY
jgi:hypothetical protein